jgi:hypothetical protein
MAATARRKTLEREIERLVSSLAPTLPAEPGVGPISAGFLLLGWTADASAPRPPARLAGTAPIPASLGTSTRQRLDRRRRLIRALHTIVLPEANATPQRSPTSNARSAKANQAAKLYPSKRYLAHYLYRLLQRPAAETGQT